jgi:hypothetical protein
LSTEPWNENGYTYIGSMDFHLASRHGKLIDPHMGVTMVLMMPMAESESVNELQI